MKRIQLTLLALLFSFVSFAVIGPITGSGNVCAGGTTTLSDTTAGGTWSSSNTGIATVGSATGVVSGISAGTATITYTTGTGFVTAPMIVNPLPNVYTMYFAGSGGICSGSGTHIFLSGSQTGVTYQLYRGVTAVGTPIAGTGSVIDFGLQTAAGTYSAVATNSITGCTRSLGPVTLTLLASPGPITGPSAVCVTATVTLSNSVTGGTWSSSNPAAGSISTGGVVTGLTVGTTTISYTMSTGCYSTYSMNVVNLVSPITGTASVCLGSTTVLSDATTGGTWSSSNPSIASIGSTGIVSGVAAGTANISYSVGGGCGAVGKQVTVRATPAAITGITSICAGSVSTLHSATTGGTWSSANPAIATVGALSGVVASVTAGSVAISYTVSGCSVSTTMAIDPTPVISGPTGVCVGDTIHLATNIPGSWSSSNPAVATIDASGTVTGSLPGSTTITCNSFSTGCVSTRTISVTSSCSGTPAGGVTHAVQTANCSGNADTLYLTGASTSCGVLHQWQYSLDSFSWYLVPGGVYDTAVVHPNVKTWYRCKLTCYSSALYSYSTVIRVNVYNSITSSTVLEAPSTSCSGPDFHITTCGVGPGSNIKSYYGDGTSDSTHLVSTLPDSSTTADIFHTYNLPGTYTVKQILRNGTTPQDSVTFSYDYTFCRTLPVFFYFDANNNCVNDDVNHFYRPITTEVDSNGVHVDTITSVNGFYYKALGGAGTIYRFRIIGHDTGLHMSCPTSGILYDTITAYVNTYEANQFGFDCNTSSSFNLGIAASQRSAATIADGHISIYNTFCTPETTVVTMNVNPKYTFAYGIPAPFSVVGHTVTWHVTPLSVGSVPTWPNIYYALSVPGTALTAGDTILTTYRITPTTGDYDSTNNNYVRVDTVRASYDPNTVTVSPTGLVIPCTELEYVVDFENTGNDTAHNIFVLDTLSDNLDANSIKLVSASAPVHMAIVNYSGHTMIKFDFPHINLLDSSHHGQSKGHVVFSVKAKPSLADGTVISNRASIYFDINPGILTNSARNVIGISPINGPSVVCSLATIQLINGSANGVWSRTNTNASVVKGLVTGLLPGLDTIRYTLSNSCLSRAVSKTVTVDPIVAPTVSVATSTAHGDTVCDGTSPVFTATTVNGGTAPTYQWQVNGVNTGTGSTYTYAPPHNGDVVTVVVTSNAHCATPDTATTGMVLTVVTPYIPPITLNAYPGIFIAPGTRDTFVATVPATGPAPTYQWLLNGTPIPGATTDTFISNTLVNNDSVTCVATGTDLCKLSVFNSFIITVGNVGVQHLDKKAQMALFPNPNKGIFTIRGKTGEATDEELTMEITNTLGQVVHSQQVTARGGTINETISISSGLARGMYILSLQAGTERTVFRFVVD